MYDAYSLADYVAQTGDGEDPMCRTPLAAHELSRLFRLAGDPPPPDGAALARRRKEEVERRQLFFYLCDEIVRSFRHDGIFPTEAIHNLREVAADDAELAAADSFFEKNGVPISTREEREEFETEDEIFGRVIASSWLASLLSHDM